MKAYKAFNKDLTCRDFQYEIGKTYETDEKPIADGLSVGRGFHACIKFDDLYYYQPLDKNTRICEVELLGDIVADSWGSSLRAATKIKIIRELQTTDLWELNTRWSKLLSIARGCDKISDDSIRQLNVDDRMWVTKNGADRHRDALLNDPNKKVRQSLAWYGTHEHRDVLMYDEDEWVRMRVAWRGTDRHHDLLVSDSSYDVKLKVAIFGLDKHRDILIDDDDFSDTHWAIVKYGNNDRRKILMNKAE